MPNPSNKRLRRSRYGQTPSSDGSTFTIEDGAGRGKDLVVGSGSVFNLGGNLKFGLYPTNGMSIGFLRNLNKFNTGAPSDKCDTTNSKSLNVFSGSTIGESIEFRLTVTTDRALDLKLVSVVFNNSVQFNLPLPSMGASVTQSSGATLRQGTLTKLNLAPGSSDQVTGFSFEVTDANDRFDDTADMIVGTQTVSRMVGTGASAVNNFQSITSSIIKNTSGYVDGDICKKMGTSNCGTGINLSCSNFGLVDGINRLTIDGNHVIAIEFWQRDFITARRHKLQVLVGGNHSSSGSASKNLEIRMNGITLSANAPAGTERLFASLTNPANTSLLTPGSGNVAEAAMPVEYTRYSFETGPVVAGSVTADGKAIYDLVTGTNVGENKNIDVSLRLA